MSSQNGPQFAIDILTVIGNENKFKKNFVFSPFSIKCCMALVFAGSSGETAKELAKGLRLVSDLPEDVAQAYQNVLEFFNKSQLLKIGNKVYVHENFKIKSSYAKILNEKYLAEVENINFAENEKAAKKINTWVAECTAGNIGNLITADTLNPMTGLVLLNVIYFKDSWEIQFYENDTIEDIFWLDQNKSVTVQFMNTEAEFYQTHNEELLCSILEMPYKNSDLSMLVLLPFQKGGLKNLVHKLKTFNLLKLSEGLHRRRAKVMFPKFKMEYSVELKDTLEKLGIYKIFGQGAQLNKMLETVNDLYVSHVIHKAMIDVNEKGTEATATTGSKKTNI